MQVWRVHEGKSETSYWFFRLKNGRWYRFDQQNCTWKEIKNGGRGPRSPIQAIKPEYLTNVSRKELAAEWERMFQKYSPPFIPSDIAP